MFDKLQDSAVVHQLVRCTPGVAAPTMGPLRRHWSKLRGHAQALGLHFDAMNSHTFSDQAGQPLSYKFGSLTHTDPAARA